MTPPSFTTEWDDDRIHPVIPEIDWAMAAVLGLSTRLKFSKYAIINYSRIKAIVSIFTLNIKDFEAKVITIYND